MKILNVQFKNMNTLEGEWELNFDRSPFKESRLFAITGPNGSGKSTIFDAISLGMYGEVVRQKNPSEQIISNQASDGYSMVTFSVNGNVFRSMWSLSAGKSEPAMPNMRLVELSDDVQVLEEGIVKVRNRVAELTGLDFKRFSRAVMLAQGEFAALLNALDNERMDILENIVGQHMYSTVFEDTLQHLEKAEDRLIELKEKIQNVPLIPSSQVETLQETSQQLGEDLQATERSLVRLQEREQQLIILSQLTKEHNENQIGLAEAQGRKEQMQPDLLRLEKARAAAPFEEKLEQLGCEKKKASESLNTLNQISADIANLEDQLKTLEEENENLTRDLDQDQKAWAERFMFIEKALEMDQELRKLSDSIKRLSEKRLSIASEQKTKRERQLEIQQEISDNSAQLQTTENWLLKHTDDKNLPDNIADIKDKLDALQTIRNGFIKQTTQRKTIEKAKRKTSKLLTKTVRKLEKRRNKTLKKKNDQARYQQALAHILGGDSLETLDKEMAGQKTQMANYQAMLKIAKYFDKKGLTNEETLKTELKTAEKQHAELLDQFEQEKNALSVIKDIARFETCRKQLKEKKPCPLCGALDHPYVDRQALFVKESLEGLREQEQKLERMEHQIQTHSKQMAGTQRELEGLVEINNKWILLNQSTWIQCPLGDRKSVVEAIEMLKQRRQKLKRRMKIIRKQTKKTEKHHHALQKDLDEITDQQMLADKLQNEVHGHEQALAALQKESRTNRQQEAELEQILRQRIEAINETMPRPGKETKILQRLENRKTDYSKHRNNQNELKAQAVSLKTKDEDLQTELDRLKKDADDLARQINVEQETYHGLKTKREMAFGPGDALQEQQETEKVLKEKKDKQESVKQEIQHVSQDLSGKQRQQQAIEKALADIRHRCDDIEQHLLKRAVPLGFDTIEDIERSLMPSEQRQTLEQEKTSINQAIDQYAANQEKIREKLGGEDPRKMAAEPTEDRRSQIKEARKRKDELEQELSHIVNRLERHNAVEAEYNRLLQEIEKQEKIRDNIYEEKYFFETAEEAEIKTRMREMILERLLEHSNRHLEALSGRYYLRRREPNGLELEIEDVFQKRARRPVNTLSGGESFLVSIAMALGLSDMAGNGRKIESLLIDEGFGYLDDETLYNVLSTLKSLKNKRKMVGIISHIKMLENEIPTKIKITKLSGGKSRLDVVA